MDYGDGLQGLAVGSTPAEREIGDINLVRAEDRTDLPDHARHIAIAQVDQVALQWRFYIDAVDVEQARRPFMENSAFHQMFFTAGS